MNWVFSFWSSLVIIVKLTLCSSVTNRGILATILTWNLSNQCDVFLTSTSFLIVVCPVESTPMKWVWSLWLFELASEINLQFESPLSIVKWYCSSENSLSNAVSGDECDWVIYYFVGIGRCSWMWVLRTWKLTSSSICPDSGFAFTLWCMLAVRRTKVAWYLALVGGTLTNINKSTESDVRLSKDICY